MSDPGAQVLAFELSGSLFALPVADVLEVADLGPRCFVPLLPPALAAVTTHRGDALPVVAPGAVLDLGPAPASPPTQLLVLGRSADEPGSLGLPVDRVVGLAPAPRGARGGPGPVRMRGTLDGRMLRMLDADALLRAAREAIVRAACGEALS